MKTVNVKHYGAKGNGVTDDTHAIQSAIDYAEKSGIGGVYVPSGRYNATLTEIAEGQMFYGDGMYASIIRLPDAAADYVSSVGLLGITTKSGVKHCSIRDIGYDGNAQNNREWGSGSENWTSNEYDKVYVMGLYFSHLHGRVAPSTVFLSNVYIHDTVRDSIVHGDDTVVVANNLHLANSDTDHLIYCSGDAPSQFDNVLCEGHVRGEYIATKGAQSFSNVTFRNLTKNPTVYKGSALFSIREGSAINITNVSVLGLDPCIADNEHFRCFQLLGSSNISNVMIKQVGCGNNPFELIYTNTGLGRASGNTLSNIQVRNVQPDFKVWVNQKKELPVNGMTLRDLLVSFSDNGRLNNSLFIPNASENVIVDGVTVQGNVGRRLVQSSSGVVCKNHRYQNISMDCVADYLAFMNSRENIQISDANLGNLPSSALIPSSHADEVSLDNIVIA